MNEQNSNTYKSTFFIVPSYILDLPDITLGYLKVYETIFQFWNHNKSCFLSEKALCERTNLKRTQVYAALAYFELHNELKRVQKGTKRYIIRPEKIIETDCLLKDTTSAPPDGSINVNQKHAIDVRSSGRDPSAPADHNIKKINKEKEYKDLVDFEKSTIQKLVVSESNEKKSPAGKAKDYRQDERFMKFYEAYPRHEKPLDALKAFKSVIGDNDQMLADIVNDIELRKERHSQWQDKQYIPLPASYLRSGSWMGEILNTADEIKVKQEKIRVENEARQAEQERVSKQRADEILKNDQSKHDDAKAYRQITNEVQKRALGRPTGLGDLMRSMGLA